MFRFVRGSYGRVGGPSRRPTKNDALLQAVGRLDVPPAAFWRRPGASFERVREARRRVILLAVSPGRQRHLMAGKTAPNGREDRGPNQGTAAAATAIAPVCSALHCRLSGRSGDRGPYASNGAADDPRSLSGDFLERADVCAAAAGFHVSPTRVRAGGLGINLRKRHRSPASLSACALPSSSPWLSPSLRSR